MNKRAVEYALQQVISSLDYDLHESLEQDGPAGYRNLAEDFIDAYDAFDDED